MLLNRRDFLSGSGAIAATLRFGPIWAESHPRRHGLRVLAECDCVFFGASAFAIAAAASNPGCVIIERGLSPGAEFSGALLPNRIAQQPQGEVAQEIFNLVKAEGLYADGLVHTPPVADVLSEFIRKKAVNIFLNAEITAVRPADGGYEIRILGSDGHSAVRCRRIVDTTPLAWRDAAQESVTAKYLSAALVGGKKEDIKKFASQGFVIYDGALDGESYFRIKLKSDASWSEARLELYESFEAFSASGDCPFRLGAEATEFGYEYSMSSREIAQNWRWMAGAAFPDLISALDGGALWS